MNREDKIKRIYEVIADKTLGFGCGMESWIMWSKATYISQIFETDSEFNCILLHWENKTFDVDVSEFNVIWHPVMIWDVLDWIWFPKLNINRPFGVGTFTKLLHFRTEKRKPIEDQSIECIDFIYSLLESK